MISYDQANIGIQQHYADCSPLHTYVIYVYRDKCTFVFRLNVLEKVKKKLVFTQRRSGIFKIIDRDDIMKIAKVTINVQCKPRKNTYYYISQR